MMLYSENLCTFMILTFFEKYFIAGSNLTNIRNVIEIIYIKRPKYIIVQNISENIMVSKNDFINERFTYFATILLEAN